MKFYGTKNQTIAKIQTTLLTKFKKMKSRSQCIIELNEIKNKPNETIWEFEKNFKSLLDQVIFPIALDKHKDCFIVALLSHMNRL